MKLLMFVLVCLVGINLQAQSQLICKRVEFSGSGTSLAAQLEEIIEIEKIDGNILLISGDSERVMKPDSTKLFGFEGQAYSRTIQGFFGPFKRGTVFVGQGKNQGELVVSTPGNGKQYGSGGGQASYICK